MDIKANVLKKLSLLNVGLSALVIKTLIIPDIATSICIIAFCAAYAYQAFLNKRESEKFDELSQEFKQLKEKDLAELKSALTALKLNQGIKKLNEQQAGPQQQTKRFF